MLLLLVALVFIILSLWFSNTIVDRVRQRERTRVEQWGEAIRKKAALVNLTNSTFNELQEKERLKVELWAKAIRELAKPQNDYTFFIELVQRNDNIPVLLVNEEDKVINNTNIFNPKDSLASAVKTDSLKVILSNWKKEIEPIEIDYLKNKKQYIYHHTSKKLITLKNKRDSLVASFNQELIKNEYLPVLFISEKDGSIIATNISDQKINEAGGLKSIIKQMKQVNPPIRIAFGGYQQGIIYYENSEEVKQLQFYPYVQFGIIGLIIIIAYLVFSTFRKAEQNQVWVGMAKETAHQLGTPLSSLMAWSQYLETQNVSKDTINEINKDVHRLQVITERFSKIGSGGALQTNNVYELLNESLDYLKTRLSAKVSFELKDSGKDLLAQVNAPLLEWVVENITKNAVDAMKGEGQFTIEIKEVNNWVTIDLKDTGKGIPQGKLKTVFNPGFTTKKRGWGLGLSLAKRIINDYHKGKIFVLNSEVNKGTTFRIQLKKAKD